MSNGLVYPGYKMFKYIKPVKVDIKEIVEYFKKADEEKEKEQK